MSDYGKRAGELFVNGNNCAEAVAGAFARTDEEREVLTDIASGFGGGVAGTREMCGAVSGMLIAAGLLSGGYEKGNPTAKQEHYALCRELMDEFRKTCGSIICHELREFQMSGNAKKYSCEELCILAADILSKKL